MVATRIVRLAILVAVIGGFACNRLEPPPTAPSAPIPAAPLATPPIRGVLRETNGGPIAGVSMWLFRWPARTPEVITDAAGVFTIAPSQEVCAPGSIVTLQISDSRHWFLPVTAPPCTNSPHPPEVTFELKGQPALQLTVGSPVETTLSNDDLDWAAYGNEYSCGPCKQIRLPLPSTPGTALVHLNWTGPDPVHLWLEGENDDYEFEKLAELIPIPGEHAMTLIAPQEFRRFYPWLVKVGLPVGSRSSGGFSELTTVHLEVESVP